MRLRAFWQRKKAVNYSLNPSSWRLWRKFIDDYSKKFRIRGEKVSDFCRYVGMWAWGCPEFCPNEIISRKFRVRAVSFACVRVRACGRILYNPIYKKGIWNFISISYRIWKGFGRKWDIWSRVQSIWKTFYIVERLFSAPILWRYRPYIFLQCRLLDVFVR